MHALIVIKTYLRLGILNVVQYRADFFMQVLSVAVNLVTAILGIAVIFNQTGEIGGWSQYDLVALVGIQMLVRGIINLVVQPSMQQMMEGVRLGTFDFMLTKPADSQLLASVAQVNVAAMANVLSGLVVLGIALAELGGEIGLVEATSFVLMLLAGVAIVYAFLLMLTTTSFWFVRLDNVLVIFNTMFENAGKWPINIFPGWLRSGLTFVVPVAFAVTVPAEAMTGRLTITTALGGLALAAAFIAVSRWFWFFGLKHYTGASA
jgi:ABC-2 type transport system permease protein